MDDRQSTTKERRRGAVEAEVEARHKTKMGHVIQIGPPTTTISRTARPRRIFWRLIRDGGWGRRLWERGAEWVAVGVVKTRDEDAVFRSSGPKTKVDYRNQRCLGNAYVSGTVVVSEKE
ncbi:hypothetical protein FCV25MIE_13392 [Fagus crenata]